MVLQIYYLWNSTVDKGVVHQNIHLLPPHHRVDGVHVTILAFQR